MLSLKNFGFKFYDFLAVITNKTGGKKGMMRKMTIVLVVVAFACTGLFLMTSCAKKQVTVGEAAPPPVKGEEPPAQEPMDTETFRQEQADRMAAARERETTERERAAAKRLRDEIRSFENENIYFDFDKSELKQEARAVLVKKAEWLKGNPEYSVRIEGNCDERGTNEYNLALGERRANAAKKFLNALGISGNKVSTISYGEEMPLDPGHNADAWAKNRNDQFKLIK